LRFERVSVDRQLLVEDVADLCRVDRDEYRNGRFTKEGLKDIAIRLGANFGGKHKKEIIKSINKATGLDESMWGKHYLSIAVMRHISNMDELTHSKGFRK